MGSVASVLICQQSPKEEKGKWMWRHKSLGLLTGMIVAPRIGYRLMNAAKYKVGHPTGKKQFVNKVSQNDNLASCLSHKHSPYIKPLVLMESS